VFRVKLEFKVSKVKLEFKVSKVKQVSLEPLEEQVSKVKQGFREILVFKELLEL
jgi:hypothetical protein